MTKMTPKLARKMRQKAIKHNACDFRVVAVGFTRKGNLAGIMLNAPSLKPNTFNTHAECRLMLRYGKKLGKIVVGRFGNSGDSLPIDPCPQCAALAASYGITISSLQEELE